MTSAMPVSVIADAYYLLKTELCKVNPKIGPVLTFQNVVMSVLAPFTNAMIDTDHLGLHQMLLEGLAKTPGASNTQIHDVWDQFRMDRSSDKTVEGEWGF